ncbi:cytochrome P450 [Eremomyces bilateralis CBS 781.70]|uniref:Cytochrome P450 n=1 Tax=Eremomyces bilateralis CBS 781.70 TaxID=1392243 RepID=A0A6G1GBV1_9PEZI|nr:cytochrome P450 [Eremomyces bilateralis CBS 781.70]KAF1815462.1 cytochrome P450 [Eremomyces bilateralis CBS 781.70]
MKLVGLGITVLSYAVYWVVTWAISWRKSCQLAKASGFPYIALPLYPYTRFWMATCGLWLPIIRKLLPTSMTDDWIDMIYDDSLWLEGFAPHEKLKSDTYILAAPGRSILITADPAVITQIAARRSHFPKPLAQYTALDVFGKNVVTTEAHDWRRHRKLTSPPFTEKNNRLVWQESIYQAAAMLTSWVGKDGKGNQTIQNAHSDTMKQTLHVISRAIFNVRCLWPGVNDNDEKAIAEGAMNTSMVPEGHKMSYVDSMNILLHRIIPIIVFPSWFMKYSPWGYLRETQLAYTEWGKYLESMYQKKKKERIASEKGDWGLDVMGAMIDGSGLIPGTPNYGKADAGLSESEILGNAFVFALAGHETSANTLFHVLLFLALNPWCQKHLQEELDNIFQGRPISEWDYDNDLNPLFGGYVGAVMNETLRLIPPVIGIPKTVLEDVGQPLTLNGKVHILPRNLYIVLSATTAHRNPKYWPNGPPRNPKRPAHPKSNVDNDMEEFKPERWILDPSAVPIKDNDDATVESEDLGVNTNPDTANTLFRPTRGAYIPFSEGFRSCLGRRFAQVEILATMAVIFQKYSVELAVDEWASDAEVERMLAGGEQGRKELGDVWWKAKEHGEDLIIKEMKTILTIQLRKGKIPLRFVRRGEEKFGFIS